MQLRRRCRRCRRCRRRSMSRNEMKMAAIEIDWNDNNYWDSFQDSRVEKKKKTNLRWKILFWNDSFSRQLKWSETPMLASLWLVDGRRGTKEKRNQRNNSSSSKQTEKKNKQTKKKTNSFNEFLFQHLQIIFEHRLWILWIIISKFLLGRIIFIADSCGSNEWNNKNLFVNGNPICQTNNTGRFLIMVHYYSTRPRHLINCFTVDVITGKSLVTFNQCIDCLLNPPS